MVRRKNNNVKDSLKTRPLPPTATKPQRESSVQGDPPRAPSVDHAQPTTMYPDAQRVMKETIAEVTDASHVRGSQPSPSHNSPRKKHSPHAAPTHGKPKPPKD